MESILQVKIVFMVQHHAGAYFYVLLGVLALFLVDAIREMRKYAGDAGAHIHLASELKGSVKLFRAQRNFYITGFAIFLAFVIRRLVNMLIIQDELTKKAEKIIKEAEATVKLAKSTVMAAKPENDTEDLKAKLEQVQDSLNAEKSRVKELEEHVSMWKSQYEQAVRSKEQAASVNQ